MTVEQEKSAATGGTTPPPNVRFSGTAPPPRTRPLAVEDVVPQGPAKAPRLVTEVRAFLKRHERKLWWLHSVYALGLGASVVVFANKGFDQARFLAFSLAAVWLLEVKSPGSTWELPL